MWPKTIVMTKDECRGALRRLELESYAALISVFRAQGCLNDVKSKVLEDLRNLFHISLERHRAEARRVANDEQLATIAESLAGPNTWQEWAREGRRPFPLLSRVPPKTALNIIANKIAARVAAENAKLPLPAETGDMYIKERAAKEAELKAAGINLVPNNNIVVGNPYPPPNIPDGPKRTIKRNAAEGHNAPSRKRAANDASTNKLQNALLRKYQHITSDANPTESPQTSNTQNIYQNQNSTQQPQQQQQQEHNLLQQQEHINEYQPPQTKQRATKRTPQNKRPEAQARISKRKQNLLLQEQMHMRHHYSYEHLQSGDQISHLDAQAIVANADYIKVDNVPENDAGTYVAATSRRDVSKNYARLHLPATVTSGQFQHLNSPTSATLTPIPSTSAAVYNKYEKHTTSATLRKFVVDDNQTATLSPQSSPHILTFPHNSFSATASKLRAVNTTILPPGTKITAKRMPTSTIVSNAAHSAIAASGLSVLADQASITPALTHAGNSGSTTTITPASGTQITKLDMLNNAAAIISGGTHAGTIAGGATIMKKLHTPVLISESNSNSVSTNSNLQITPIGSASPSTAVFRKPSNIIKTNYIGRTASSVASTGASTAKISTNNINTDCSKLLGNIKLVPTISATPATASQHQFLQQQLKNVNTTGLRTSVKICQSANGKVFIQPANIDSSKTRTPTSNTQKTMPIPISASSAQSTGPRIAIQKVQIMPAASPTLQNSIANYQQQQQQQQQQKSHTIGNKIYKPATVPRTSTGTMTQTDNESSTTRPQKPTENKQHNTVAAILPSSLKSDRNQIITEDTPIDILSTPIYVDSNIAANHPHSHIVDIKEKVTVLSNSPLDPVRRRNITIREKRKEEPTIVLGVTDWEVELDQARAFAAANRLREPYHTVRNRSSYHCEDVQVVVDDSYEDEIIVEDTEDSITGSTITARPQEYAAHEQGGVEHSGTIIIQPADYAGDGGFDETIEIDENSTIEYIEHDPGSEDNMDKTEAMQINAIADREYLNDIAVTYATK